MASSQKSIELTPQYASMPVGGLPALAALLYPADAENTDVMAATVTELLALNTDVLRSADTYVIGQQIRVS